MQQLSRNSLLGWKTIFLWSKAWIWAPIFLVYLVLNSDAFIPVTGYALGDAARIGHHLEILAMILSGWVAWKVGNSRTFFRNNTTVRSRIMVLLPFIATLWSVLFLVIIGFISWRIGQVPPFSIMFLIGLLFLVVIVVSAAIGWVLPIYVAPIFAMMLAFNWLAYGSAVGDRWIRASNISGILRSLGASGYALPWQSVAASTAVAVGVVAAAILLVQEFHLPGRSSAWLWIRVVLVCSVSLVGAQQLIAHTAVVPADSLDVVAYRDPSEQLCTVADGLTFCHWPEMSRGAIAKSMSALIHTRSCLADFPLTFPTRWAQSDDPTTSTPFFGLETDVSDQEARIVGAALVLANNGLGLDSRNVVLHGSTSDLKEAAVVTAWGRLTCGVTQENVRAVGVPTFSDGFDPVQVAAEIHSSPHESQVSWLQAQLTNANTRSS